MARSRYPAPYAILHLSLRFISVGLCIATMASASYATSRGGYGTGMVGSFIASVLTMMVDLAEISGLVDPARDVPRFTETTIVYLEMMVVAICGIVPVMVLMAYTGLQRHDCEELRPKVECDAEEQAREDVQTYVFLAWILPLCLVGMHLIFSVLGCFDCFQRRGSTAPSRARGPPRRITNA